jgi:tetratricopeptide (TPR) repeat protein
MMVALQYGTAELDPVGGHRGVPQSAVRLAQEGSRLLKQRDFKGAVSQLSAAIDIYPNFTAALNNRAAALGYLGRLDEAHSDLDRAIALNPQDAAAKFNRALVATLLGRLEAAEADLDDSLSLEETPAAHNNRGSVRAQQGKHREAIDDYDRALALDPTDNAARYNRSYSLLMLDELDAARSDIDVVLSDSPNLPVEIGEAQERRRQILNAYLWRRVRSGGASWSGGKPIGSKNPLKVPPGSNISDYIVRERDTLRGSD